MSIVRPSASFIAEHSQFVHVDKAKCRSVAAEIYSRMQRQRYSPATWASHELNPNFRTSKNVVDWIFTVDCLNFSFWSSETENRFTVDYKNRKWTGYWSMVAAINRALDENIPITSPMYWVSSDFTEAKLAHIFRSSTNESAPLLSERFAVLKEAGNALQAAKFTSFEDVVKLADHSALKLVEWVTSHIPSFKDAPMYRDRQVFIYKRAQILAADIWACFEGETWGQFDDIGEITMFADYRVPQILVVLGCLRYEPQLLQKIADREDLTPGSAMEVEIRGCSIEAVEIIVREINKLDPQAATNAVIVDFYLWDTAKMDERENTEIVECHRTRSVYY